MERDVAMVVGVARDPRCADAGKAILDRTVEAMRAGADALAELRAALDAGRENPQPELMIATTAILEAGQAAADSLDIVAGVNADARPRTRYRVTCPKCGGTSITEWTDILPPGGVSPVQCAACGYMILSESEGNPVEIADHAPPWARGYVHVYTGNGKGKTTAALGLALRAAGAGVRVFIAQFAKGRESSEHAALGRFADLVVFRHYGNGSPLRGRPTPQDVRLAAECFRQARRAVLSGEYAVVILDEANVATHFGLLAVEDLLELIDGKPPEVEIVITGRWADARVVKRADLVTEMKELEHYYARGVRARPGIER